MFKMEKDERWIQLLSRFRHRSRHSSFSCSRSSSLICIQRSRIFAGTLPNAFPLRPQGPLLRPPPIPPKRIRVNTNKPSACQKLMTLTPTMTDGKMAFQSDITTQPRSMAIPMKPIGAAINQKAFRRVNLKFEFVSVMVKFDLVVEKFLVQGIEAQAQVLHGIPFS